ncbi:hypothetical protein RFI_03813 [Reticulomyxa filosa]|uniref:Uncharacterized protein n=1 Tax=Reticulomyxa filosa TaxID=46433 RepID=X6P598_RETFI|nr:hypothetical protein RFI_03813 [Reticulomyxa filosa]|eukprot:ETO33293.1 hypothetical protein RFI_03813 [Reticulomyxa filosa]
MSVQNAVDAYRLWPSNSIPIQIEPALWESNPQLMEQLSQKGYQPSMFVNQTHGSIQCVKFEMNPYNIPILHGAADSNRRTTASVEAVCIQSNGDYNAVKDTSCANEDTSKKNKSDSTAIIIAVVVSSVVLIAAAFVCFFVRKRRRRNSYENLDDLESNRKKPAKHCISSKVISDLKQHLLAHFFVCSFGRGQCFFSRMIK